MNDYKELVTELKELSDEEKEFASNSGDIYCAERLALAADAIEQLVADNERYKCAFADLRNEIANYCETIATLRKERNTYAEAFRITNLFLQ